MGVIIHSVSRDFQSLVTIASARHLVALTARNAGQRLRPCRSMRSLGPAMAARCEGLDDEDRTHI